MEIYHLLNGDALKTQFPNSITGEIIVLRECLIDGNRQGVSLKELLRNRQHFLQTAFGASPADFTKKLEKEIERLLQIPTSASVHLWFEEDLFCQANFWFSAHLIHTYTDVSNTSLVLPSGSIQYGFGGMDQADLVSAFRNKQFLTPTQMASINEMWLAYQNNHTDAMLSIAKHLATPLPFLTAAVQAHINRLPDATGLGHPERLILTIQQELQTTDFPSVFKEFSKRAPVYGFGDLQVKRIWERMNAIG